MSVQTLTVSIGSSKKKLTEFYLNRAEIKFAINNVPFAELKISANNEAYGHFSKNEVNEMEQLRPGSDIAISRDDELFFSGVVTERIYTLERGIKNITLRAHHKMQAMRSLFRSQLFSQQDDASIIKSIFNDHGIKLDKIESLTWKHPQMVQFNCFDWQFVRARLNANGVWLLAGPVEITIVKPGLTSPGKILSADEPGKVIKIRVSQNNRLIPKRITASSWSIEKQAMSQPSVAERVSLGMKAFDPTELDTLSQQPWTLNHSLALLPAEQTAWANSRLLAMYSEGIQGEIELEGNTDYQLGQTLAFQKFGSTLEGQALITGVAHTFTRYEWHTQLTLGAAWLQDLDIGMVPGIQGVHMAQIAENKEGPDKNHCLKVTLPVMGKNNKPLQLLARLSSPFASNESGLNIYPEENDEVVLAFLEDDPRFPIILGAMHNPVNPAPHAVLNKGKGFVIKKGDKTQSMLLHPEEGMVFEDKQGGDNTKITFKQGELSTYSSKTTTIEAKGLVLKSSDKLDASVENDVSITGSTVKIIKQAL